MILPTLSEDQSITRDSYNCIHMCITLLMSPLIQLSTSGKQTLNLSFKLWAPTLKSDLCSLRGFISHPALLSPCWKLSGCSSCGGAVILWTHAVDVSPSGSARGLSLSQGKPSSSSEGEHPLKSQTRVHYIPSSPHLSSHSLPPLPWTPPASLIPTHTVWFSLVCLCPSVAKMNRGKFVLIFSPFLLKWKVTCWKCGYKAGCALFRIAVLFNCLQRHVYNCVTSPF